MEAYDDNQDGKIDIREVIRSPINFFPTLYSYFVACSIIAYGGEFLTPISFRQSIGIECRIYEGE